MSRRWVTFQYEGQATQQVSVAGTFNEWDMEKNPLRTKNGQGIYRTRVLLEPGTHEYKFVVDGEWLLDPTNDEAVPNGQGSSNSVLTVG